MIEEILNISIKELEYKIKLLIEGKKDWKQERKYKKTKRTSPGILVSQ